MVQGAQDLADLLSSTVCPSVGYFWTAFGPTCVLSDTHRFNSPCGSMGNFIQHRVYLHGVCMQHGPLLNMSSTKIQTEKEESRIKIHSIVLCNLPECSSNDRDGQLG